MLTIDSIITLASEASPKDYSWALLLAIIAIGGKAAVDIALAFWKRGGSKDEVAQKLLAERDAKIAEMRHESLQASIDAVGEKIDSTNKRISAIELEITRLRDSDNKLTMEIERLRASREAA